MKNKILSKMMMVALIISSMFLISACSSYQKDVNIASIEIKENSVPATIQAGGFDSAGITLIITYEDDTSEEMPVTSELIPEAYHDYLTTPGTYKITILFKGFETELTITIVENVSTFSVKFYDAYGRLISTQNVESGEDATAPTELESSVLGYEFVGWDRTFTNVTEDINVYGIYAKVEILDSLDIEEMRTTLLSAVDYLKTENHYVSHSIVGPETHGSIQTSATQIYLYDKESGIATGQLVGRIDEDNYTIKNFYENCQTIYTVENGIGTKTEEEYLTVNSRDYINFDIVLQCVGDCLFVYHITNYIGDEEKCVFQYSMQNNKLIYSCTITMDDTTIIYVFDDTKILSYEVSGTDGFYQMAYIDYVTYEIDESLIPND